MQARVLRWGRGCRPVLSVAAQQKELLGQFRNKGRPGGREATEVTESACASEAACRVVPYGVYDVGRHTGFVVVGMFHNTPAVAGSAITKWGSRPGGRAQRGAAPLVILADWQTAAA